MTIIWWYLSADKSYARTGMLYVREDLVMGARLAADCVHALQLRPDER